MPANDVTVRSAMALVLGLALLGGCRPETDGEPAPRATPAVEAVEAGAAATTPDWDRPVAERTPTTYRLGIARSGVVVVVIEALGPIDAVRRALEPALQRAVPQGPGSSGVLDSAYLTRLTGGRLRLERTSDAPLPLVDCVSVAPWSGADTFLGVAYEDRVRPAVRLSEFVLRYPTAVQAADECAPHPPPVRGLLRRRTRRGGPRPDARPALAGRRG